MRHTKDDVHTVIDGNNEETVGFYLRGYVCVVEARAAISACAREQGFETSDVKRLPKPVYERWRKLPSNSPFTDVRFQRKASGRGAFPVTHVEVQKWS